MCLLAAALLCGCHLTFDPCAYIQACLDAAYKGDFSQYLDVVNISEEDAERAYEAGYKSQADVIAKTYDFCDENQNINMSDSIRSQAESLCQKLYSQVWYEVTDNTAKVDRGYTVDVVVHPLTTLQTAESQVTSFVDGFNNDMFAGKYQDEQTYPESVLSDIYAQGVLDVLVAASDQPTYAEAQTVSVHVLLEEDGESYFINHDDLAQIQSLAILYPGS